MADPSTRRPVPTSPAPSNPGEYDTYDIVRNQVARGRDNASTLPYRAVEPVARPAGTPKDYDAERAASGSIAPPLRSYSDATKFGLKEFGGGLADVGKGVVGLGAPPNGALETGLSTMPAALPLYRMSKGVYDLGKQALQVPGALRDLASSPDPMGTLALTAPRAGGQAAGMAGLSAILPSEGEAILRGGPDPVESPGYGSLLKSRLGEVNTGPAPTDAPGYGSLLRNRLNEYGGGPTTSSTDLAKLMSRGRPYAPPKTLDPNLASIWDESAGFRKPETVDIGQRVRAKNPEPTRAEVKAARKKD